MAKWDQYIRANRENWNELVPIHASSRFYDVDGFKSGKITLTAIEREEVGNVSGMSLLHLQCHFGLDTLSWARLGAKVTGVDFSDKAIGLAESLSRELGLEARFICSDVYNLPDVLEDQFDIVFTSYGVLCWLPDLEEWARIISRFTRPGGIFYIIDDHPLANVFYAGTDVSELKVAHPYFYAPEPFVEPPGIGTYASPDAIVHTAEYEWVHSLGEIINTLVSAGLRVEFLHEFSFDSFCRFPFMEQGTDGWWRFKNPSYQGVPLMFSLKARK